MSIMRDRISSSLVTCLFLFSILLLCYLHYRAEINVRGSIPANSDSLAYQNSALHEISLFQKDELSFSQFTLGVKNWNFVPPLHKWGIQLGYALFGIDNFTPYLVTGFWIALAAWGIFLLVQKHTADDVLAGAAGLLLMALPVTLRYGFTENRNDWPVVALCLVSFHFFCSSDFFADRTRTLLGATFAGLALLVKSSLAGYLFLPAVFLLFYPVLRRGRVTPDGVRNIIAGVILITLLAGWFYVLKANEIFAWYSFWSGEKLADVKTQYQLQNSFDESLFYIKNLFSHLGLVSFALVVTGWLGLCSVFFLKKSKTSPETVFSFAWAAVFAFGPYVILYVKSSFSSLADLNMVPFQVFLGVSGLSFLFNMSERKHFFSRGLLALTIGLNVVSVANHYQTQYYQGVDTRKASSELVAILDNAGYHKIRIWGLYNDIYFNAATVLNYIYLNPLTRAKFDAEFPDLSIETQHSPRLSPEKRYKYISEKANLLLIPDLPKGFKWITINREWDTMKRLVTEDGRFLFLGCVSPYDDGTLVSVYGKQTAGVVMTSDGWMQNGAVLQITAKPGLRTIVIKGERHGHSVADLRLLSGTGGIINGKPCQAPLGGCYIFDIKTTRRTEKFTVESTTPMIPSKLGLSHDSRELLLFKPEVLIRPPEM